MELEEKNSLLEELTTVFDNIRAEVIIAEIENDSTGEYEFLVNNMSSFSRSYKRDIISVENSVDTNCHVFNLSRNGLYDSLPEGFFHGRPLKGQSFVAQRVKYREEEKQARLFFGPLENEFFRQRLQIEKNERELLSQFYKLKDNFLIDFWNIDTDIPENYLLKLIKLLPFAFKVSGDTELTRLCLEKVLNLGVTFEKKFYADSVEVEDEGDNDVLGMDMVLPSTVPEIHTLSIKATIGPVENNRVDAFLKENGILKFVNLFYEYFMPVDVEVFTKIIATTTNSFSLDKNDKPVLGISTTV